MQAKKLSEYPEPVRLQLLAEMSVLDIMFATVTDPNLSAWMREKRIWRHVWQTNVLPRLPPDAPRVVVGEDERMNCVAWHFALTLSEYWTSTDFEIDRWMVHKTIKSVVSISRTPWKWIGIKTATHSVTAKPVYDYVRSYSAEITLLNQVSQRLGFDEDKDDYDISRNSEGLVLMFSGPWGNAWETQARIFYTLLEMGFYFKVTNNVSETSYNVREKI